MGAVIFTAVGIACYADSCITYGRVCLSVCPSVTRWYCVETNEAIIMRFSPSGRTIILAVSYTHLTLPTKRIV